MSAEVMNYWFIYNVSKPRPCRELKKYPRKTDLLHLQDDTSST